MKLFIWTGGGGGYSDGMVVVLAPDLQPARRASFGIRRLKNHSSLKTLERASS